jgi:hypothetical protein
VLLNCHTKGDGIRSTSLGGRESKRATFTFRKLTSLRAPGLKFGFTGEEVAITFGPLTTDTTLIGYRIDGQDWQFTNVTTNATHLLVSPNTLGVNLTTPINPSTFELRVSNWAYGVQIASVHVAKGSELIKVPEYSRTVEVIGDSLSAGQYATLEGLASYSYGMSAGLGDTEYSITAYPGICLFDKQCYGNLRGMFYQWFHTSDTSGRAIDICKCQFLGESFDFPSISRAITPESVLQLHSQTCISAFERLGTWFCNLIFKVPNRSKVLND